MFNQRSIQAVQSSVWRDEFRRPHPAYSFAQLPHAVRWLLGKQPDPGFPLDVFGDLQPPFDHVVLCFIDAFGWEIAEPTCSKSRLLSHGVAHGVLSQITAMFPSTTAAHVTTIHTGQTPAQSGVYSWQYYEPLVGTIIEPLPFSFLGNRSGSLAYSGIQAHDLFPSPTIYSQLASEGVHCHLVQPSEIVRSPANEHFTQGATPRGYRSLAEALVILRRILSTEAGPSYTQFYYDRIDSLCHKYTIHSEEVAAENESLWMSFDHLFFDCVKPTGRTVLLISADHGHMDAPPESIVYLNHALPALIPLLQCDRFGRPLAPVGSSRDFFLHVQPAYLAEVEQQMRDYLRGRAEVVRTEELLDERFFGPQSASPRLLDRVGNLAILPRAKQMVWWHEGPISLKEKHSSHGGLTPQEMEIPLFVIPLGC